MITLEVTLSALMVLGSLMKAKYLDADYIPEEDIVSDYYSLKNDVLADFNKRGIVKETFTSSEINDEYKSILEPLFFGTTIASIFDGQCKTGESKLVKFHFYNGAITKANLDKGVIKLEKVNTDYILKYLNKLVDKCPKSVDVFDENNMDSIERVVIIKRTIMNKSKDSVYIYKDKDALYAAKNDGEVNTVSSDEAICMALTILKEEQNGI